MEVSEAGNSSSLGNSPSSSTQIFVVGEKLFGLLLHWEFFITLGIYNWEFFMTLFHYVKHVDIYLGYTLGPKK